MHSPLLFESSIRRILPALLLLATPAVAQEALRQGQETLRLEVQPPDFRFQFQPRFKVPGQRSLALALGGGAAKGIAHAGVLQRMEEEGLPPDSIAGTSMGAYMGGMYAVGYSGLSIQTLFQRMDFGGVLLDRQRRDVGETLWEQETRTATLFSVEIDRKDGLSFEPGASSGLELKRLLQWLLSRGLYYGGADFDHLRVPFRAVSTDLQLGMADAPAKGSLVDAVRASLSIPGMFRPVMVNGHQHVDGILVENLPVLEAKAMNPKGLVIAVEVGGQLDAVRKSSVFGVMLRTLDVSIEERTRFSRRAADVLLRPDTSKVGYLDFFKQVPAVVAMGRDAFDQHREDLERGLYGPEGEMPVRGDPPLIDAPGELRGALSELIHAVLPAPGQPLLKRHYYRLLRRVHGLGIAKDASVSFDSDGNSVLHVSAQAVLGKVILECPEEWRPLLTSALEAEPVQPGRPFNPAAFGRALDRFLLETTLLYRPTLSFEGTAFDEASGSLRVVVREPRIAGVQVVAGILPDSDTRYLERLLTPLNNGPMDSRRIFERVSLAEVRLNLEEVAIGGRGEDAGPVLIMTPVLKQRLTVDAALAYESTWGFHAGLSAQARNFFGTRAILGFQASTNRLQDSVDLDLARGFHRAPRSGLRFFANHFEQHFLTESLVTPAVLAPVSAILADRSVRERGFGFGYYQRFGGRDQGLWRLDLSRRWSALLPGIEGLSFPSFDTAQLSAEWDNFDRYTFPSEGTLIRIMGAEGKVRGASSSPREPLHYAYLRGREILPLLEWMSLDLDLESGLGWKLPLSRWYSVGGPSFILGTPSAGYLTPNFALLRVGVPLRVANLFGLSIQVEPRLDFGFLGSTEPTALRQGSRVRGAGLVTRTEVGRFFVELAVGRAAFAAEGQDFKGQGAHLNLLVGTRPYDLWRRR